IRDAGMTNRTTVFIVADHGFKAYTKEIHAALALDAAALKGKTHVVNEGGSALVYVQSPDLIPQAVKALEPVERGDHIYGRADFPALGLPLPERDRQMSDLFVTAKTGYSFAGATGGPVTSAVPQQGGSHGYVGTDPEMDALFIASGYGIAGGKLDKI